MKSENWWEVYFILANQLNISAVYDFCPNYVVDCFNFLLPSACLDTSLELTKKMREFKWYAHFHNTGPYEKDNPRNLCFSKKFI